MLTSMLVAYVCRSLIKDTTSDVCGVTMPLCRVKDQQLRDVNHQLQAMLDENQHLRTGRRPKASQDAPAFMDSSAVIEHRLLPFKEIKVRHTVFKNHAGNCRLDAETKWCLSRMHCSYYIIRSLHGSASQPIAVFMICIFPQSIL